jgi:hypothetical protein
MKYTEPFTFLALKPDGANAYHAYENIHSYYDGAKAQYARIYEAWQVSSQIKGDGLDVFRQKRVLMKQVVRDIHCLLVFLQVIWKTLKVLTNGALYPHFATLSPLKDKWEAYFEQYRELRNTLEHYDDQVLGTDSKNNSPGFGLSLSAPGWFLHWNSRQSIC